MIQIDHISKSFGSQTLFDDIVWQINPGERIGLVGPNGAGKSTLCRILAGLDTADSGRVVMPSGWRIGYLPQEVAIDGEDSVLDTVLEGCAEILALEARMEAVALSMAEAGDDIAAQDRLSARYGELEQEFQARDGYAMRARARSILAGMGFDPEELGRPISTFSGGWQMRAYLSRLLLMSPELLLMDEPTNHLDLPSLEWLEGFLRGYGGSVVIISHDRYFLNRMVTRIADMARGTVTLYKGDYDGYITKKAADVDLLMRQAEKQRREIAHMEDFVRRFKAKATKAKQAQSRVKALEKIERIEVPDDKTKSMAIRFPQPPRSGQEVIRLSKVRKAYDDLLVYENVDFRVERGERIALVGPNGAGKTTLLKILAETVDYEGERMLGYNVSMNFFAQHQVDALNLSSSALEEMESHASAENIGRVRSILGAFLFSGDTVEKKVQVLSGGEKSRLALARMMLQPANLLLLDEPTNHLDIQSRDVLEDALAHFEGTICFVSHDRHFINALATRVVHVEAGGLVDYPGDYEYYTWKRQEEAKAAAEAPPEVEEDLFDAAEHTAEGKKARKRREAELRKLRADALGKLPKELAIIESAIAKAEARKETLQARLADPALYTDGDPKEAQSLAKEDAELDTALEDLFEQWEALSTQIEEIESSLDA